MASDGHLGFVLLLVFHHKAHFLVSIGLHMSNLIMIGHTVQKLLAFLFSKGNALKVPKIVFVAGGIIGVKTVISIFLYTQKTRH